MSYTPGPGDILGQYAGHPHDPRTPDGDDDDTTAEAIDMVHTLVCSAAASESLGDRAKAKQKMIAIRDMINELFGQKREHI